jgi:prefoldin subunit 5
MTIDERLERLTERHEALTQSIEILTHDVRELHATVEVDAQNIRALARIAEIHEHRLTDLEGSPNAGTI